MFGPLLAFVPWLLVTPPPSASKPPPDTFLRAYAETRHFRQGHPTGARVTPDGKTVLFLRSSARSPVQSLFAFDVGTGKTEELLTPETLLHGGAQTLSSEEKARLERRRIMARGFTGFVLSKDGARIAVTLSGKPYVFELATRVVIPVPAEGAVDPKFSPDGTKLAYVRQNDLHVFDLHTRKEHAVTQGGTESLTHGLAEFVAQEEMDRSSGFWWSPDSQHLAYEESNDAHVERLAIVDPLHPQQGANVVPYPRAGTANVQARLGIVSVQGGPTTWVAWDTARAPYLAAVVWPAKGPLTMLVQNRPQTEETLYAVDAKTGHATVLLVEKDAAWLNLTPGFPRWLDDGSGFLWATERGGATEVELRRRDGSFESKWLGMDAHFSALIGLDSKSRTLFYTAAPTPPERVAMASKLGASPVRLVPSEDLVFEGAVGPSSSSTLALVHTSASRGPRFPVMSAGRVVGELPSDAEPLPFVPNVEFCKVGPGEGFYTYVVRPRSAAAGRKLPVLVSVYGGPTQNMVLASAGALQLDQWLADQGFIVIAVDNRGTPGRGHDWERAIKGNFAGVALDDQVTALRALGARFPQMDLQRVGIFGWSFGGYLSALAVLKRSDVFKAAMAGAPVADWRDYDTHYTERYLGLPAESPEAYQKSSLLTYADGLRSRLLLVHGTADDNVYFFHSLKLSDALFRAGKAHDFLPLSGQTHGVAAPVLIEQLWRQAAAYFHEQLGAAK